MGLLATSLAVAGVFGTVLTSSTPSAARVVEAHPLDSHSSERGWAQGNRSGTLQPNAVHPLPVAPVPQAAPPAAPVITTPLAARENFAFAPYWTLPQSATFSLVGLSTLAYFSLGVNANGTLEQSGPGWAGYQSPALVSLITRAHAAGERVVLTVNDFDQASLNALTSSPSAPATLAAALMSALEAKGLDGVNFDFEGHGSQDQAGLTHLVAAVSGTLRAADPHWQVTMDTYASSAGDPGGFYDIPALAPSVDAFFVMAYELNLGGTQTAAAPLTSGMFSDQTALAQYTAVVPADKVILGTGFFGIDWPTNNGTLQAQATGPAADIPDSQIQASGEPQYWDPSATTGWTSYQVGAQWHESYYEDPLGLFEIAQLAAHYDVRGVGIWALGMEDNDTQMIAALDGVRPAGAVPSTGLPATSASPGQTPAPGASTAPAAGNGSVVPPTSSLATPATPATPATTTTTTAPPTTTTTATASTTSGATGTFHGVTESLTALTGTPVIGSLLGTLTQFASADPAEACLALGPPLTVYADGTVSGDDVAVALPSGGCAGWDFTFPA
jgi:spore germination protein